ncbi:ornithine carbamoyltransferase [Singulisphaera sp. GP187]|uniref:ornithine carbamoyltransferase n=1 Tax=Singulisphaera sp. GP187 TaxID=1882752 RepID=UPI000929C0AE|nr:ornithine carbamoyltransferase [Singulisphaera sp. GP187]SIO60984.1 ornithine carbamoyltransferase [Singulisphaera sp. GP187]
MIRHFVDLFDLSAEATVDLIDRAIDLKRLDQQGHRPPYLEGRTLGLIFEKPSLRTRVSFEAAIAQLGGNAIFLNGKDVGMGVRESIPDFARVISQYVDVLAVRTFAHKTIEALAQHATIPVVNALSDAAHPCQALADVMTIKETLGHLEGVRLVFVGDGNNVARSLALASALVGIEFVLAAPEGYEFPPQFRARYEATFPQIPLVVEHDPQRALVGADVVYTDVWASMGQEHEAELRRAAFAPFQVNRELLSRARDEAIFLHCLPARREEEVTSEVLDGPQSVVIPQAANRLHFQKALLIWLLSDKWPEELTRTIPNALQSQTSA